MSFEIRPYHPSDLPALYRVCLQTGDNGQDATMFYLDPDLLAHYYVGPYLIHDPDLCFTLTRDGVPCGYMIGTRDTAAFVDWCEREWLPVLRRRYPLPDADDRSRDAGMVRMIHATPEVDAELADYPAHLHIDLLPVAQGQGWGYRLMQTFFARLQEVGVPAVHLGVGRQNQRAVRFYERVGFHKIEEYPGWIAYGMRFHAE